MKEIGYIYLTHTQKIKTNTVVRDENESIENSRKNTKIGGFLVKFVKNGLILKYFAYFKR